MSFCFHRCRLFLSNSIPLTVAALVFLLADRVLAQGAADRADIARTQAALGADGSGGGEINGHAVSSPNDADLGEQAILKRQEGYQPFTVAVALPVYYTSNVALARSGEQNDFLEAPVVALSYQPRLTNRLYAIATVREQLFYYDRFDALNFGSFNVEAGLIYLIPECHNLVVRGEFIYNRLTERNSSESLFSDYSIFVNAELPFRLGRAQQLSLGVDANISMAADPEQPRRNDYETYAGYTLDVTRSLSLNAVGRLIVRQYQLTDRVDVSEVLATSANFNFGKYFTASAISTLAANQSNHSTFDYKVANVGGLLSLSVKF